MNDRLLSTITLSKRAGKLILGFDVVKQAAVDGTAKLILLASDLSPKTCKEVQHMLQNIERDLPALTVPYTMDELWMNVNKRAGVLAITDQGFADKLYRMLSRDNKEDSNL